MKTFKRPRIFIAGFMTICMSIISIISGCQKSPINGSLDGQWQVMDVSPKPAQTTITERIYYCFYLHTCQLTVYGDGSIQGSIYGRFEHKDDEMTIDFPDSKSDKDMIKLSQYGINSNPVHFTVEHLDKKKMILRDGETVVTLRKF